MKKPAPIQFLSASTRIGLSTAALAVSSHAAIITWEAPHDIASVGDVSTTGTLIGAVNLGDVADVILGIPSVSSTTVNGVFFQALGLDADVPSATVGSFNLTTTGRFLQLFNGDYGSTSSPFNSLPTAYQTLLDSAGVTFSSNSFTLTMSNLTPGYDYLFQWWANDSGGGGSSLHSAVATNAISLTDNVSTLAGGLGQYATGSFTADATTQTVAFNVPAITGSSAQVNAFQLRQTAVPEPGTAALLAAGLCFSGLFLRRRKSAPQS